jgi:hypothetical protein
MESPNSGQISNLFYVARNVKIGEDQTFFEKLLRDAALEKSFLGVS